MDTESQEAPLDIAEEDMGNSELRLPIARVKKIMKADPELTIVNHDAVFLVAKATESFIESLVAEAYKFADAAKRKTISKRDIDSCIENIDSLVFLDGVFQS